MRQHIIDTLGFTERIWRPFAVLRAYVIHCPVPEETAVVNEHVRIYGHLNLAMRFAKVLDGVSYVFKLDFDIEGVGRVAPAEWADRRAVKTPTVHGFLWMPSAMKQPEV